MKDHTGMIRGFSWSSRAYYAESAGCKNEINIGMYCDDEGGTTGEMSFVWHDLGRSNAPRLECFDDGWSALASFGDLLESMAKVDGDNITQLQFVEMLLAHGFKDMTKYENPYRQVEK